MSSISQNIKIHLKKKAWSVNKLAKESGLSYITVSKIVYSIVGDPQISTLRKIAKALRIKVDDLLK